MSEEPADLSDAARELDRAARPGMAFDPPLLVESAAAWSVRLLYRSCQFLAYREVDEETVRRTLSEPCPEQPSPAVCYSVDLAMRYIPELLTLSRGIAPGDPLVDALVSLAKRWPLSSVGSTDLGELDPAPFIDHPSLRQLYVDRVLERRDLSRLRHPMVRQAAAAAIGGFPELATFLAKLQDEAKIVQETNSQ